MADAGLGHNRDGDSFDDLANHARVRHASHAALGADLGGHALERHDGNSAGFLGDDGLLNIDDVHDDAAFEHLRQAGFEAQARRCKALMSVGFHGSSLAGARASAP